MREGDFTWDIGAGVYRVVILELMADSCMCGRLEAYRCLFRLFTGEVPIGEESLR